MSHLDPARGGSYENPDIVTGWVTRFSAKSKKAYMYFQFLSVGGPTCTRGDGAEGPGSLSKLDQRSSQLQGNYNCCTQFFALWRTFGG